MVEEVEVTFECPHGILTAIHGFGEHTDVRMCSLGHGDPADGMFIRTRVTTSHRPGSPDANHALRWDRNLPADNADFGSGISATAGHRPYWYPERRIAHSQSRAHAYTYDGAYPYGDTWA